MSPAFAMSPVFFLLEQALCSPGASHDSSRLQSCPSQDLSVLSGDFLGQVALYGFPCPANADAPPCTSLHLGVCKPIPRRNTPTRFCLYLYKDLSLLGKSASRGFEMGMGG